MSSSTSSSERRVPWGALWGLGFFLALELVFRQLPARFFLNFDQNDYRSLDTLDFTAVSLATELLPPPEVVVLGTSRGREAVQSPVLAKALAARLGRPVEVRNYSSAAGRIDVSLALFDRLAQEGKLPRVVVLVLDASDFRDEAPNPSRWRYVTFATLRGEIERNGWPSEKDFAHVLGNSMPLRLAQARAAARYRLVDRGHGSWAKAQRGNPALGGTSAWARMLDEQVKERPAPPKMREEAGQVGRTIRSYKLHDRALERLRELDARAHATGTQLVLAESPAPPVLRADGRVPRAQAELGRTLAALADGECTRIWISSGSEDYFGKHQFRDPSHLNSVGARAFVALVAPAVADAVAAAGRPCAP
jgi:hypothetical protein